MPEWVVWLWGVAQVASPPFAVFCIGVAWICWKQLLFERQEHRTAERGFTEASTKTALALNRLAMTIDRPRRESRRGRDQT